MTFADDDIAASANKFAPKSCWPNLDEPLSNKTHGKTTRSKQMNNMAVRELRDKRENDLPGIQKRS